MIEEKMRNLISFRTRQLKDKIVLHSNKLFQNSANFLIIFIKFKIS